VSAYNDVMVMLEGKIPKDVVFLDENHDWSTKIIDECIVNQFVLASISPETYHSAPFLNKLQSLGVEEILCQIKLVDNKTSAVLAEYIDYDLM